MKNMIQEKPMTKYSFSRMKMLIMNHIGQTRQNLLVNPHQPQNMQLAKDYYQLLIMIALGG